MNGAIDHKVDLSGVGAGLVAGVQLAQKVTDTTRVSSVEAVYSLHDFTADNIDGPIVVGVAHGDYSTAEIEAYLKSAGSWEIGNKIAQELRSRRIRIIGTFDNPPTTGTTSRLNDGKPIKTKLNWLLAEDQSLKFFGWNKGISLLPSGPHIDISGHANLWAQ